MPPRRRSRKRNTGSLRRAGPTRDPYDRVLIVCEGSKTEPGYFMELRSDLRINGANMTVIGDGGSAPQSVVQTAIDKFQEDADFDSVYCVFDKDEHTGYVAAVGRVRSKRLKRRPRGLARFEAITSVPCFEYWLLLHFVDTDAPFERTGANSAAQNVVRALARHIPGYSKGANGVYESIRDRIEDALARSERIFSQIEARGGDNPSTRMHELIRYLRNLTQP